MQGYNLKKLFILFSFFLIIISSNLFAQNADLKHYSDYSKDFDGWATALFLEDYNNENDVSDEYLEHCLSLSTSILPEGLKQVSKLTKNNDWLFRKALNEWDYKVGELYCVICSNSKYSTDGIIIFAIIKSNKNISWRGYIINESDLQSFME